MKRYVITIDSGLTSQEIEAENEEALLEKIDSGHYGIMPVRGNSPVTISRANIVEIKEL